jgi:hypothetical protein
MNLVVTNYLRGVFQGLELFRRIFPRPGKFFALSSRAWKTGCLLLPILGKTTASTFQSLEKLMLGCVLAAGIVIGAEEWNPHEAYLKQLVGAVPGILRSQHRETGRFGTEPWITEDQNIIFPLVTAWALKDPANPYYHDPVVLEAIIKGGDALADAQDKNGYWTFRKKDNSTWGQTLEPWAFSRWMRACLLIHDAMPPECRQKWERGLLPDVQRLASNLRTSRVHNKTTYHAATVYAAGLCFQRDDWKRVAHDFMAKVVAAQAPGGWWSEHSGPVVNYNTVYVEALGMYYALSHDAGVLEALRRAAVYHATLTYPNGSSVETVDERNPFHAGVDRGNVGFSFTPEGRGYLLQQSKLPGPWSVSTDDAACHLLYGATGSVLPTAAGRDLKLTVVGNNEALVLRSKPWFICLSAFTCEQSPSRWIQDRQNFVSIFHDDLGLIIGGGNTKLQPFWSNFTIGDTAQLKHQPGDENPDFKPKGGLLHMPSAAHLRADQDAPGLDLTYGAEHCYITVRPLDAQHLTLVCEATAKSSQPVEGHVVFLPHLKAVLKTATGKMAQLTAAPLAWTADELGAWFTYGNLRISVPPGARLLWPAAAHNPYKKDGSSKPGEARLVLCLPFASGVTKQELTLELVNTNKSK